MPILNFFVGNVGLMLFSGLSTKFAVAIKLDSTLDAAWFNLSEWSEKNRYDLVGVRTVADATKFINSVKTIIQWIKAH